MKDYPAYLRSIFGADNPRPESDTDEAIWLEKREAWVEAILDAEHQDWLDDCDMYEQLRRGAY